MSKKCDTCGAMLKGSADTCRYCGAEIVDLAQMDSGVVMEVGEVDLAPAKKKGFLVKLIALAVVAALISVIVFTNFILNNTGYRGLVGDIADAYQNYDLDALVEMSSGYAVANAKNSGVPLKDTYKQEVANVSSQYESQAGDFKITYKIRDAYDLPAYRTESVMEILKETEGFDSSIISKILVVRVDVTVKGGESDYKDKWELLLSKESGEWKLLGMA